jgi:hypothetical protein
MTLFTWMEVGYPDKWLAPSVHWPTVGDSGIHRGTGAENATALGIAEGVVGRES